MKWFDGESEIIYRILAPSAFISGSIHSRRVKDIIFFVGTLKGGTERQIQSVRFPKKFFNKFAAKSWIDKNKERILANKIIKNAATQSIIFSKKQFSKKKVQDWAAMRDLNASNLREEDGFFILDVIGRDKFQKGTLRRIEIRDGILIWQGLLKNEIAKSYVGLEKKLPDEFSISGDLYELEDLNITEVTLTKSPAVGTPADFVILKSVNQEANNYNSWIEIVKTDDDKKQVFAYALVPDIFDSQGHRVTKNQISFACHSFMKNLSFGQQKGSGTGLEHQVFKGIGYPIESFIDENGIHGTKGGWWLGTQVVDESVWQGIKSGKINGYSIGGKGKLKKVDLEFELDAINKNNQTITNLVKENNPVTEVKKSKEQICMEILWKSKMPREMIEPLMNEVHDLEKAIELEAELMKAINPQFTWDNGYAVVNIVTAMKKGDFGQFPTNHFSMTKSVNNNQQQPTQQPTNDSNVLQQQLQKSNEMIAQLQKQVAVLQSSPAGVRQSTSNVPVQEEQPAFTLEEINKNIEFFSADFSVEDAQRYIQVQNEVGF